MLMLKRKDTCPVDYQMCKQTVTVYHKDGDTITRTVHSKNAFFDFKKTHNVDKTGSREVNSFLLVIPCSERPVVAEGKILYVQPVFEGDKVMCGEGPKVTTPEEWAAFIPAKVPGLVVVKYADPKYWRDRMIHVEAGG